MIECLSQDGQQQKQLDAALSGVLVRHHYTELPDRYFSNALPPDTFDREQYSGMPLGTLAGTTKLYEAIKRKWIERAAGWRLQEAQAAAVFERTGLNLLRLHRDHCRSHAEVSEKGIVSISKHITDLENYRDEIAP